MCTHFCQFLPGLPEYRDITVCVSLRRCLQEEQQLRPASLPAIPNPFPELCSPAGSPVLSPIQSSDNHVSVLYLHHLTCTNTHSTEIIQLTGGGRCAGTVPDWGAPFRSYNREENNFAEFLAHFALSWIKKLHGNDITCQSIRWENNYPWLTIELF